MNLSSKRDYTPDWELINNFLDNHKRWTKHVNKILRNRYNGPKGVRNWKRSHDIMRKWMDDALKEKRKAL